MPSPKGMLEPKIVIPMHYKTKAFTLKLASVTVSAGNGIKEAGSPGELESDCKYPARGDPDCAVGLQARLVRAQRNSL